MIQALTNQPCVNYRAACKTVHHEKASGRLGSAARRQAERAFSKRPNVLPIIAAAGVLFLSIGSAIAHRPSEAGIGQTVIPVTEAMVVGRGDSLWELARRYGDANTGMQERVDALAELNGLKAGAPLIAGQKLLVPISNPVELARRQVLFALR